MRPASEVFCAADIARVKRIVGLCAGEVVNIYDVHEGEPLMTALRRVYPKKHPKFWDWNGRG